MCCSLAFPKIVSQLMESSIRTRVRARRLKRRGKNPVTHTKMTRGSHRRKRKSDSAVTLFISWWVVWSNKYEITTTRCPERENLLVKYRIESMLVAETWKWIRRSPSGEKRDVSRNHSRIFQLLLGVNRYRKEKKKIKKIKKNQCLQGSERWEDLPRLHIDR